MAFEIDDIEADWAHAAPFDFIHGRMLTGSIKNWPRLFQQCFEYVPILMCSIPDEKKNEEGEREKTEVPFPPFVSTLC